MKKFCLLLLLSCLSLIVAPHISYGAYCTPTWVDASSACTTYGMDVAQFRIVGESGVTFNDVTACTGSGYENLTGTTSLTTNLMQSVTYNATYSCSGSYRMDGEVWIDFNNNTTFETSESVGGFNNTTSTVFSIAIPLTAATGSHRMRIVVTQNVGSGGYYPGMNPCAGYYYGDARDYNITVVALPACTGTPTGGTAASTRFIVCPSESFTCSVTGGTTASGMTYQWQRSSDSSSWGNITGATNYTYTTTETATYYYRRVTTCTSTSGVGYSSGVRVGYISVCYCTPYYSLASLACYSYGMDIIFHVIGESGSSINDAAACDGSGYLNRTVLYDTFKQGVTYHPTISCSGTYNLNCQAFIDFNDDGTFAASETVGGYNTYTYTTFNLSIPVTAPVGMHRLRVVESYGGSGYSYPSIVGCPSYTYGEARDYTVYVVALPACTGTPSAGNAISSVTMGCPGIPFTVTDTGFSIAGSLTFQWQSSPDSSTWTNISGATNYSASVTASAVTYYRCIVTCSASGSSAYSAGVRVNYLGICFCRPVMTYGPSSCSTYHFALSRVQITGESSTSINDVAGCSTSTVDSGYIDRTTLSVTLMQTVAYTLTLTPSTGSSSGFSLSNQVWIDFNDNGTFESSETVAGNASYSDGSAFTENLIVPLSGSLGTHRMRVIQVYNAYGYAYPSLNPCTIYTSSSSGHYYYGDARDYMVTIVPLPPCSGTPTAGTVTCPISSACPAVPFTLSLSGSTIAGSLTWQWQRSSDSSTWTSISGATNFSFTTTETATYYYRCIVTCTVSGSSATTPGLRIIYVPYCYCTPVFTYGPTSCSSYHFAMSLFKVIGESSTSINDASSCSTSSVDSGYTNRTSMSATFMQTVSYTVTIAPSTSGSSGYTLSNQIWIDFNDNGTFESSESVGGKTSYSDITATTETITIPFVGAVGTHRMRVIQVYSGYGYSYPTLDPCTIYTSSSSGHYYYGEARDYTAVIIPLPPCSGTPTAGTVTTTSATACPSYSFTLGLAGSTIAGSLTWQWQSSPDSATWSNISGATSPVLTLTETSSLYYRCIVTCTISGSTVYTPGLLIPYVGYCYCTPSFSSSSASCASYHFALDGFDVNGEYGTSIHDAYPCDGTGYHNFTSLQVTLMNTLTYTCTVKPSTAGTFGGYNLSNTLWIDFNSDGTFAASEAAAGVSSYSDASPVTETITIPSWATTGVHRARLMQTYTSYAAYPSMNPCSTTYTYGEARDYSVNVVPLPPCSSGTPSAGTAIATTGTACPGVPFTLTDYAYGMASGLTFQWEISSDSTTWTTISGATTVNWTLTQTGPKYYRCKVTCSTTGAYAYSVPIFINYISYCYCTPSYTSGAVSCGTYHMTISRNFIAGAAGTVLNDTAACTATCYENLTGSSVSFFQGTTYQDSLSTQYSAGAMCAQVWIDFNNDGNFSAGESVGGYNNYVSHIRFNLTIPGSAPLGPHRMRVVTSYAGSGYSYSGMDPCTYGYSLGDARDYTAYIVIPGCTGTPSAGTITASDTSGCSGYTTSFSLAGASTGTGILYQWQSSPDNSTWTSISGATSATYTTTITAPKYFRAIITCGTTTFSSTSGSIHVSIAAPPASITGTYFTCSGSFTIWADSTAGGTWSSSSTSIATANPTSGYIYGVATGTAVITYTLPTGCYTTRSIIVNPSPASITGTTSVCVGSSVTLFDATSGGVWTSSNTSIATVNTTTGVVTGLAAGSVTISYTLSTGCTSGSPTTTTAFTVNPLPSSITGPASLCMGYPATLSSSPSGGTWSSSATGIATISPTSGSVTGMSTGSAIITYTTAVGCKTSTSITVNPVVVPTLSISATPTGAVCAGTSVTFNSSVTNPGSSPTFVWRVNGTIIAGGASYTYAPANGDVVSCWFHSSATCAVPDSMTTSMTMSVNPVVTPSVTATTGVGDTVCLGTVTTLTATPFGGGSSPIYHWYINGIGVSTTGSSYAYIPTNGDVVTVRVISNQACRTADSGSYSKVLTVSPYVTPTVTLASSLGSVVCTGSTVAYTGTGMFGGTTPTYQWFVGSSVVGAGTSYSYAPANGDTVKVVLTSNFPCVTTTTAADQIVMTVIPSTTPVGVVTVAPGSTVAPGTTATFTCTITSGGGSAPTYQWTKNGVPMTGATNSTYATSSLVTGDVVACIVSNTDPCSAISTFSGIRMTVSYTALSVNQTSQTEGNLTVLPNPNNGTFVIKGNLGITIDEPVAVEITNMLGQVIYTDNIRATRGEISQPVTLSGKLANGMYILNVKSEHLNKMFHFVLEQ